MVNNVISAPFSWSVDPNGAGGTWNAAYESWFSVAGGTAPDAAELMIWINYNGGAGPAGSYQGTVSIGGHSWDVYFVDWSGSAGWYYIAYKITSPADNVDLDLRDFMDDAIARGFLDPSWYLDAMEAGFEIWRDGEGLTSNSFSASIIGIENDPPSVSITSPANGATFNRGDTIVIEADASDGDGSVTKVEFYQGATKLGEDTSSPYSYTWHYVLPGYYTLTARATDDDGDTTTSSAVNIQVIGGPGAILREWWTGIPGEAVVDLTKSVNYPDKPSGRELITTLEGPTNWANYYGTRIRGYLYPPADGNYTFWIASDDKSELWLSTDDNPANTAKIAYVPGWTESREWNKDPNQQSLPISLTAGQKYYVEVLQKEGSGGDNVAVAWQGPGLSQQVINGAYLSPCCLDFRVFAGFGDRWGRSDCNAANNWCGGFDSDHDGSIVLDDLQVFVDSWLAVASGPVAEWTTYPGYEASIKNPMCVYDGNIICRGTNAYGILLFNGETFSYGAKPNYSLEYLYPLSQGSKVGILAQSSSGYGLKLEYTATPTSGSFTDVTPAGFRGNSKQLHRSAVDCGEVNNTRIVLFFEYGADNQCNAWFSTDNCLHWTRMWGAKATGIRHFHGGVFEPNVGNNGRLYVFTGDSDGSESILICDDVYDLITNPEVWYGATHWALGAGQRVGWISDGNYVLGWNDQKWRTCDMVSDGVYGYWMPDCSSASNVGAYKVKHSDKAVTMLASYPRVKGVGWIGLRTSGGNVIFATTPLISGNAFSSGSDEYVHLYQIKGFMELNKWRFCAYNPFVSPVIAPASLAVQPQWLTELNGIIYLSGLYIEPYNPDLLGTYICSGAPKVGSIGREYTDKAITPITNPVLNSTFDDWNGTDFNNWGKSGSTWSQDANITEGGHLYSARCVVASGTPYIRQDINAVNLPADSWVTVKVKVRVASGAGAGFLPQIGLYLDDNLVESSRFALNTSASATALADDKWHEYGASCFIRNDVSKLSIRVYANNATGTTGTVYLSDVRIESGVEYGHQHF
jgi:hypothetical protein